MTGALPRFSALAPTLALAAGLAPLISLFAPLGMAPLFILVALAGLHDCWRGALWCWRDALWRRIDPALAAPLATIVLLGALSTLWAIDKTQTARTSLILAGEFLGGLVLLTGAAGLEYRHKRRILAWLAGGLTLAVALLLFELLTPGVRALLLGVKPGPDGTDAHEASLSRGLTFVAIMLVPATAMLWRRGRRLWAAALFACGLGVIVISHSLASKLALPAAMLAALLLYWRPRPMAVLAAAISALAILAALPLALSIPDAQTAYDRAPWLSASGHHRLTIWRFSAQNTLDRPVLGWALDASRVIPGADDPVYYNRTIGAGTALIPETRLPLHPHSAPVQLWLELGAAGATAGAAFVALAFVRQGRRRPWAAATGGAALTAGLVVACVSYGIWQSWWLGTLWLCAALVALAGEAADQP